MADDAEAALEQVGIELQNLAGGIDAAAAIGEDATQIGAVAQRMGQTADKIGFEAAEGGGKLIKFNGQVIKNLDDLKSAISTLSEDDQKALAEALANKNLGNRTAAIIEKAKASAASGKQALVDVAGAIGGKIEDGFAAILKQLKGSESFAATLLKYTTLAAATYGILEAVASAKTGCYAVYGQNQQMIDKAATGAGDCVSFTLKGTPPVITMNASVSCQVTGCPLIPNATTTAATASQLTPKSDNTSCNCLDSNGNLVNPNVALSYESPDVWDVLGGIVNGIGGMIVKLADDAVKLVDAAEDVIADLPKILMWTGIGLAIVGVLVGIGFIAKKIHDKKKLQKSLKGGCWKDGRQKSYKAWKKNMKLLQKKTPISHLTTAQALF